MKPPERNPFDVDVDGRIYGEAEALRQVTSWMVARYRESVAHRSGAGSPVLMAFLRSCAESVRIREAVGPLPLPEVPPAPPVILLSAAEAAAVMGCTPRWVRHLAQAGRVPARRVGRTWLIERQED